MNSTAPSNPLVNLLMSSSGGLQPQGLQGAPQTDGEGDFASVMSQLSGKSLLPTTLTDGQNLPLTMDTAEAAGLALTGDAELLMMQIETPPSIRYVPSSFNQTASFDNALLQDALHSGGSDDELMDGLTGIALLYAGQPWLADQPTIDLSDPLAAMRQSALKEGLQGRHADAQSITLETSWQVEANDDGYMSSLLAQSPAAINTPQSALAAAINAAQLPAAAVDAEAVADTADVELSADVELKSMNERLQTQLRERLEFGQDRREWGGALGARIATMVADNIHHARIQLDPPELGSLEIKLQVMHDQATVQVHAQNHQVREVLEANSHRLRDALQGQGLTLAQFDVSEQASGGNTGDQFNGNSPSDSEGEWSATDDAEEINSPVVKETHNLLDTFA